MMQKSLIEKIGKTVAGCSGKPVVPHLLAMYIENLEEYAPAHVSKALDRCLIEVSGHLSIAHIIERIPKPGNARLSADEAWAELPRSEAQTVVWTPESAEAWGMVKHLIGDDDTAARMAFREAYNRLVTKAEHEGREPKWEVSLGTSEALRESTIQRAIERGRLTREQARGYRLALPEPASKRGLSATGSTRRPDDDETDMQTYIRNLKKKMGVKF